MRLLHGAREITKLATGLEVAAAASAYQETRLLNDRDARALDTKSLN